LIGPPGTGKTNFLKTMFAHVKENVQMTYDENLINQGGYFSDFLNSNNRFLVIEDADLIIQSRSEGNRLINKFLNTADGIIPNRKKKLIFTTNLPNLRDVDKAMIRPGRCFDILQFRHYDKQEAIKVAEYLNIDTKFLTGDKYTLADIYDMKNNFSFHSKITEFGFV
jgi:SpoVK/Ycf46/Vps4 family AAA+-type ATPase